MELEKPAAEERKAQAAGQPQGAKVSPGKFPEQTGRSREKAAEGATGSSGRYKSLDKIGKVKAAAESDETPEPVREAAQDALDEMDRTGRVDGALLAAPWRPRGVALRAREPGLRDSVPESRRRPRAPRGRHLATALPDPLHGDVRSAGVRAPRGTARIVHGAIVPHPHQ
jgi:hypothetical protein